MPKDALKSSGNKPYGTPDRPNWKLNLSLIGLIALTAACGTSQATPGYDCPTIKGGQIQYAADGIPYVIEKQVVSETTGTNKGVSVNEHLHACTAQADSFPDSGQASNSISTISTSPDVKSSNPDGWTLAGITSSAALLFLFIASRYAKKPRRINNHPHAKYPIFSREDYRRHELPHTEEEFNELQKRQENNPDFSQEARFLLDQYELDRRPPYDQSWPVNKEHTLDTGVVAAVADLIAELGYEIAGIILNILKIDQITDIGTEYSEVYHHDRSTGYEGPTTVNPYRELPHYLTEEKVEAAILTFLNRKR